MIRISPFLRATLCLAGGAVAAGAHAQIPADANAASPLPAASTAAVQNAAVAIEACNAKMQALLAALDRHDYTGAETDFSDTIRASLTPEQLQQAWESLPAKFGQPGPRGAAHNSMSGGYIVITVPTPYQNASLAAQIACGADGKIVGFHVMTLTPPAAASTAAAPTANAAAPASAGAGSH